MTNKSLKIIFLCMLNTRRRFICVDIFGVGYLNFGDVKKEGRMRDAKKISMYNAT